ncbi:MAG: heparinase II/III-family protein, partial [Pacificimonas sp.]
MAARGVGAGAASGLQRLESGQTVVVADAGPPPDADLNPAAHAGALAFEYSDGEDRIVTNVGGGTGTRRGVDRRLDLPVRMTAAHSTLTLDDHNQSDVEDGEPLGQGVDTVEVERRESEEGLWIEASHDGYLKRFGLTHARDLFLSAGGTDLRGEDRLEPRGRKGAKSRPFTIRFHLTPTTDVTPTADGKGALLKTASGKMWQMKLSGGTLTVDDSLWIGEDARAHRTRQLVISGETSDEGARVRWRFNKVR